MTHLGHARCRAQGLQANSHGPLESAGAQTSERAAMNLKCIFDLTIMAATTRGLSVLLAAVGLLTLSEQMNAAEVIRRTFYQETAPCALTPGQENCSTVFKELAGRKRFEIHRVNCTVMYTSSGAGLVAKLQVRVGTGLPYITIGLASDFVGTDGLSPQHDVYVLNAPVAILVKPLARAELMIGVVSDGGVITQVPWNPYSCFLSGYIEVLK
jgi:hypothetical protein